MLDTGSTQPDDATLVRLAQGGDAGAFGELVVRHQERLWRFLASLGV